MVHGVRRARVTARGVARGLLVLTLALGFLGAQAAQASPTHGGSPLGGVVSVKDGGVRVDVATTGTLAGVIQRPSNFTADTTCVTLYQSEASGGSILTMLGQACGSPGDPFSFPNLAPGGYSLCVADTADASGGCRGSWAWDFVGGGDLYYATVFTVVAGQTTTATLAFGGTIAATPRNTAGESVTGGCVDLYSPYQHAVVGTDCAGVGGTYSFHVGEDSGTNHLGTYELNFRGFSGYLDRWYFNRTSWELAEGVTVESGGTTVVADMVLRRPGTGSIQISAKNFADGLPASGGSMDVYEEIDDTRGFWVGGDTTGSGGTYTVSGLVEGRYRVQFQGFDGAADYDWYGGGEWFTEASTITLSPGQNFATDYTLQRAPGGSISGTVSFATGSFALPGDMSDVAVDLYYLDGTLLATVTPSASGAFSFTGLGDAYYLIGFGGSVQYPYRYWPSGRDSSDASIIAVRNGAAVTGIAAQLPSQSLVGLQATLHASGNWACVRAESTTSDFVWLGCLDESHSVSAPWVVAGGLSLFAPDTYIISAYEYDPVNDRYTDDLYWNTSGKDRSLRSNATPVTPQMWAASVPAITFNFAAMPWEGANTTVQIALTSSVYPLYVGAETTLTATATGDSGTPSGVVQFFDDRGFIGDSYLSPAGTASIPYTVTHHGESWLMAVYYRGDTVYDITTWSFDPAFLPTIDEIRPQFGPSGGGTLVTIRGFALTDVTDVTFGGVPGTWLNVLGDTYLTVVAPPGTDPTAPVVLSTSTVSSHWTDSQFFAYTDGSVLAGTPSVIADVANFTPNVVRCYQVTGNAGVPVGATGVVLNVTASLPNAVGHVRVYPDYLGNGRSPAPLVSTVNFEVNRDVANSTTISLPSDGKVCAYGVGGTLSRLILDVDGYTLPGSGITLITPEKLVDTRPQAWYHTGTITGPVQPMTDYEVQVGGVGSVPSDAVAVIANITVVDTNYPGHLRMWASDQTMPDTSVVNYAAETKANSQIVALSADGKLTFRSFSWVPTTMSPVQVLIDVTGYIAAGSDFVATVPTKLIETRPAYGIVGPISSSLSPNTIYPIPVDTSVVPAGATAVVLNVTAVQPTNFGHIRVYPDTNGLGTTPPPVMSNLNFIPGRDIPNMVIVQLPADRTIDLYTAYAGTGRTDLVVNIIGYITGPTP